MIEQYLLNQEYVVVFERCSRCVLELEGWNCMPHCASLSNSFYSVSVREVPNWYIQNSHQQRDEFVMIQLLVGH